MRKVFQKNQTFSQITYYESNSEHILEKGFQGDCMKKSYTIKRIYTNERTFEELLVDIFLSEIRKMKEQESIEERDEVK